MFHRTPPRLVPSLGLAAPGWWGAALAGLAVVLGGCHYHASSAERLEGVVAGDAPVSVAALHTAMDTAASYLAEACDDDGRFRYRVHLDAAVELADQYNELRHAGTIYALTQYYERTPKPQVREAILRASHFLQRRFFATVADNRNLLAVWSESDPENATEPRQAKLGGAALALVALLNVERIAPGKTSDDDLRRLGRFLIFMQKPDGSFYSKFYATTGRDDIWQSNYYPGEAALALMMLHEYDSAPQWLHTATKALVHLAEAGMLQDPTFPDQWYLLALQRWMANQGRHAEPGVRDLLLNHARHLCRDMLQEQQAQLNHQQIAGCFTPEGRTCPTATRLEGLLAALQFLPPEDEELRRRVADAVESGMAFLINSQVREGPYVGGFPRFTPHWEPAEMKASERRLLGEIRIDYVQHALSAMIAYETVFHSD